MTDNWRSPQSMGDLLGSYNKRIGALERRDGAASTIVDIVGVAQNKRATLIDNWDSATAADNGYFWSRPGALHSPDPLLGFTGSVIGRSDNSGMQQVWNTDDLNDVRYFMRTYTDDGTGQGRTYSNWRAWSTPSGLVELTDLGETVQDYLTELADAIDAASPSLLFFEQDGEPVPGVSGVPATIPVGSSWIDTDDNRTLYIWDGTAWVSAESTLFGDLAAADAALTLQVEAALDAASNAMDFAETLTKAYRQTSAPTNPDTDGRALVVGDTWFDSDDSLRMYVWSGSAWIDADFATETYAASQASAAQAAAIAAAAADATTKAGNAQSAAISAAAADATTKAAQALSDANDYYDTNIVTITGSTIQTTATASRGIKITSGGLTAYDGSGVAKLVINASTGAITMVGDLTSGSTVTGAVVTGGTLQSEATAARGIKITSGGLTAYNSSGVAQFTIDATTGSIALAGAITGAGSITGPTIQTSASAATGIKLTSSGLTAYNGSGVAVLTVNASTGAITMVGDLTSGSTVTGAVVTGGTVQSEATASRGIKMNSSGMTVYDGSGNPTFTLTAATGAIALLGSLTGAGVITGPTLRGGLWETEATANRGIKVTSAGMAAYSGSGEQTLFIDATTGVLTAIGGLLTGGSLTGGIVTGAVLQTEATANRGIKMNSTGLVAYDSVAGSPTLGQATLVVTAATGAIDMLGKLTATSFNLLGNGAFYGSSVLAGTITVAAGVPDPSVAPTLNNAWPVTGIPNLLLDGIIAVTDNAAGTHWIVYSTGIGFEQFQWIDKTTLSVSNTLTRIMTISGGWRGFVRTSGGFWGLYKTSTNGWAAQLLTSSGNGNMVDTGTTTLQLFTIDNSTTYSKTFGADGADILFAYQTTSTANVTVGRVTPSVGATGSPTTIATLSYGNLMPFYYVGYGSFDLGATRILTGAGYSGDSNILPTGVRSWNTSGTEQTSESFKVDPKASLPSAMTWDGTRFWSFDSTGISKYSTHITASNPYVRYAWEDVNATGGTHKTGSSPYAPVSGTFDWKRRAWLQATASPPPQTTTGTDDANVVRFYIGATSGGTYWLQTVQPVFGSNTAMFETPDTSGTAHPTVSTFGNIGVLGTIKSGNYSQGGDGWALNGDGTTQVTASVGFRSTTANQTVVAGVFAAMNIQGTVNHNIGNSFSRSGDVVTITKGGVYRLHAQVVWDGSWPTSPVRCIVRIETWTGSDPGVGNGTQIAYAEQGASNGVFVALNCETQRLFAANDKVRALLWQGSGADKSTQGSVSGQQHQLNIMRVP